MRHEHTQVGPVGQRHPCTSTICLWTRQPGEFFCVSSKTQIGVWRDHFFARDELSDVPELIYQHRHSDVYFCPHGFSHAKRRKQFAVPPHCLYADLDEVNPEAISWVPTIAIESSPGRYVGIWLTDEPTSEQLNRRLTYAIGADRGGWDFTQVLRVPGTLNHKYVPSVTVRTLWGCGPKYRVGELERQVPNLRSLTAAWIHVNPSAHDPTQIARRYRISQTRLNWCNCDRSRHLWAIGCEMRRRGATPDEVAAVLWASAAFQSKWGQNTRRLSAEVSKLFG
jgi:RepB DNA-primase N-terminal domain